MFCKTCGAEINDMAEICPKCGVRVQPAIEPVKHQAIERKSSGTAAICSFFIPGLGQIYNGQFVKAIFFFVVIFVFAFMSIVFGIGFFLIPVVWLWGIYDAYKEAERTHLE